MILDTNININYSKENYLLFKEGYNKFPPVLNNIVAEYLIKNHSDSSENCATCHDGIIFEDLRGHPISKWPIKKIKDCFNLAFKEDNYEIASFLVSLNRFDVNEYFEIIENNNINFLHKAIIYKKNNFFDALFESKKLNVNKQTRINSIFNFYAKNQTPLHLAIFKKNNYALRVLLKHPKIDILIKNQKNYWPYDYAIKNQFGIEVFVKQFGEAYLFTQCVDEGTLRTACENNATEIAVPLIYKFNINSIYTDNKTLLFSCVAKESNSLILKALITHPQINLNEPCPFVYTKCSPIHLALKINNMSAFRLLIDHPNINVDVNEVVLKEVKNVLYAISPLNTAIKEKNIEAVKLILNKKPKLINGFRIETGLRTVNRYHKGDFIDTILIKTTRSFSVSTIELAKETYNEEIIAMIKSYSDSLSNSDKKFH